MSVEVNPPAFVSSFNSTDYLVKTQNGVDTVIIRSDGVCIPACTGNSAYREFLMIDTSAKLCPRQEIPVVPIIPPRDLAAELDAIKPILDDLLLGGVS